MPTRKTFLITGASSGLGLSIALAALRAGHAVVGTARDTARAGASQPDFSAAGGQWLELDVTSPDASGIVSDCVAAHGVDVLINNAGYGLYGALEDMSEAEMRHQMDVNFHGTLSVTKAALPHFRARRGGTVVFMSSISGFTVTSASGLMYAASKFALEGAAEGLALQVAPFGVRVVIVEPGLFRTNWLKGSYVTPAAGLGRDYVGGPVDEALNVYPTMHEAQEGDPGKAGERVVDVVCGTGMAEGEEVGGCLRVWLGVDALEKARRKVEVLTRELDVMERIARSTTHDDVKGRSA